jgi:hypothetical protein
MEERGIAMSNFDAQEAAVIVAGRRAGDGFVRLAVFTRELLELTIEAHGERASTLLLTRDQIAELQRTLARMGEQINGNGATHSERDTAKAWNGNERREEMLN